MAWISYCRGLCRSMHDHMEHGMGTLHYHTAWLITITSQEVQSGTAQRCALVPKESHRHISHLLVMPCVQLLACAHARSWQAYAQVVIQQLGACRSKLLLFKALAKTPCFARSWCPMRSCCLRCECCLRHACTMRAQASRGCMEAPCI